MIAFSIHAIYQHILQGLEDKVPKTNYMSELFEHRASLRQERPGEDAVYLINELNMSLRKDLWFTTDDFFSLPKCGIASRTLVSCWSKTASCIRIADKLPLQYLVASRSTPILCLREPPATFLAHRI
jgi:hypothetical protein